MMERTCWWRLSLSQQGVYGQPGAWHWLLPYEQVNRATLSFHFPLDPSDHVVKRVVAFRDRIHLQNGVVCVNGQKQSEPSHFWKLLSGHVPDQFPQLYTRSG